MPSAAARQRKKDDRESASYEEEARAEADKAKEQGNSIAYIVLIEWAPRRRLRPVDHPLTVAVPHF